MDKYLSYPERYAIIYCNTPGWPSHNFSLDASDCMKIFDFLPHRLCVTKVFMREQTRTDRFSDVFNMYNEAREGGRVFMAAGYLPDYTSRLSQRTLYVLQIKPVKCLRKANVPHKTKELNLHCCSNSLQTSATGT